MAYKNSIFLADGIPPIKTGGMETHALEYILHFPKTKTYSFKLSNNEKEIFKNYLLKKPLSKIKFNLPIKSINNSNIIENIIKEEKDKINYLFFNSLYWIKVTKALKENNKNIRFILRSGGNDISQSGIKLFPTLEQRRNFVVNTINENIDTLIVNSNYTKEQFLRYGIDEKKMKVIIGGVDNNKFKPLEYDKKIELREKLGLPKNKKIGIAISRLVKFKNIEAVLKIAKKVTKEKNNVFVIVGGGPLLEKTRKFVKKYNLQEKIIIVGEIATQNIYKYYQIADYFLQMSTYEKVNVESTKPGGEIYIHTETMGRSAMEAMSSGLPIIATDVGGVSEVIGDTGILINDNSINKAVEAIMNSTNLHENLGKNARKKSLDYSWKKVFKQYNF